MIKSVGILVVLLAVAFADLGDLCKKTATDDNGPASATISFAGQSNGFSRYTLVLSNNVAGTYPNNYAQRISRVSGKVVFFPPTELEFDGEINGGAFNTQSFVMPDTYVNALPCVNIQFEYFKNGKRKSFGGFFTLARNNVAASRDVQEQEARDTEHALRSCSTTNFTYMGSDFTATTGIPTSNSWFWTAPDGAVNTVALSAAQEGGSAVSTAFLGTSSWAVWSASVTKGGSIGFECQDEGDFPIRMTVNYKCGTTTMPANYVFKNLAVRNAKKRSAEVEVAAVAPQNAISANVVMAVAGAGVAVAAVAVVAAVVITRRRTNMNSL